MSKFNIFKEQNAKQNKMHVALIGVAVAEAESWASWEWFTDFLRKAHPRLSTPGISIASDRCKGLIGAVERSFPKAHHRWCYKHLERNIRARYGVATVPLFRKCVYAKTPAEWEAFFGELCTAHPDVARYLDPLGDIPPSTYSHAFFPGCTFGFTTSNPGMSYCCIFMFFPFYFLHR